MKDIYIILSHSGTFPGWIVSHATHFPYSHVMLSFANDGTQMYGFGRKSVHNFLDGGFTVESRDGQFFTHFSKTQCCILKLAVEESRYLALCREIADFVEKKHTYKYDFLGCFLHFLGLKKTFARRYTCAHFVAEVLRRADIYQFPEGTMRARPESFLHIPGVQVIYTGLLADIPQYKHEENENV